MCGICGFFNRIKQSPVSIEQIDKMTDAMSHRGPDDRGVYYNNRGALGHRRLTIIDLVSGAQPMNFGREKASIVFNGEIYNYIELKDKYLSDVRLESTSDTEILLRLLYSKGPGAIQLLNGMFAFAFWDIKEEKVILGRDPVGQKPLFYYMDGENFVFSSELSSLLCHSRVPRTIDTDALSYYLLFEGYPAPFSPIKGVKKLPPGHFLTLDLKTWTFQLEEYWKSTPESGIGSYKNEDDYLTEFETIFMNSVQRHLRADVEVGVFLSGGLDSPSLVKAATSILGSENVKTFTIKHEDDSFNEAGLARGIAEYYGTKHYERPLREDEFLSDIDPLLKGNDEPIADPGFLAISQVTKFSREHVKVVLSGNGGDEFYAGYAPFKALKAYSIIDKLCPGFGVKLFQYLASLPKASHGYMNTFFKIQRFLRGIKKDPSQVLQQWIGSFNHEEQNRILCKDLSVKPLTQFDNFNQPLLYNDLKNEYHRLNTFDLVNSTLHMFQKFFLPTCICNHSDKASMRVSQELRSPFLDTELMKFANRLPSYMKYQKGKTKYILRKYHETGSPDGISMRRKQGFTIPIASWLTSALKNWANDILDPVQIKKDGVFNEVEVRKLWADHQSKRCNNAKKLWTIIVFQHWLNTNRLSI